MEQSCLRSCYFPTTTVHSKSQELNKRLGSKRRSLVQCLSSSDSAGRKKEPRASCSLLPLPQALCPGILAEQMQGSSGFLEPEMDVCEAERQSWRFLEEQQAGERRAPALAQAWQGTLFPGFLSGHLVGQMAPGRRILFSWHKLGL